MNSSTKEREKLKLTREQACDILNDLQDPEGFTVVHDRIIGKTRWSIKYEIVIKRNSDGKYFKDSYRVGATESQDESAWEHTDPNFTEVFPVEKTYIDYV